MIEQAIEKANRIPYVRGEQRHYCIITDKRGMIVSEAPNSYVKTHTYMARVGKKVGLEDKCFLHSEVAALLADKRKRGYAMYVARVNSKGKSVNSMPCPICMEAIRQHSNIKRVFWT